MLCRAAGATSRWQGHGLPGQRRSRLTTLFSASLHCQAAKTARVSPPGSSWMLRCRHWLTKQPRDKPRRALGTCLGAVCDMRSLRSVYHTFRGSFVQWESFWWRTRDSGASHPSIESPPGWYSLASLSPAQTGQPLHGKKHCAKLEFLNHRGLGRLRWEDHEFKFT